MKMIVKLELQKKQVRKKFNNKLKFINKMLKTHNSNKKKYLKKTLMSKIIKNR